MYAIIPQWPVELYGYKFFDNVMIFFTKIVHVAIRYVLIVNTFIVYFYHAICTFLMINIITSLKNS